MIEFVFGQRPSQKTEYVIEKMQKALKDKKKAVLIVPEQQALFWDTLVAQRFDATVAFDLEVVSFTRLADSVFRRFGGTARRYVTEAEKSLIMWSALRAVSDRLCAFKSIDREDRYVPLLLHCVSELKLYGISGEDLTDCADRLSDVPGSLPHKLKDLALISAAYDTLLCDGRDDPDEIPDALADTLDSNDYFSGCAVFIDSFYTLTPKELKVVKRIVGQADDLCVTFAMDRKDASLPHLEFVDSYKKEMARIVARAGHTPVITDLCSEETDVFSFLRSRLWDFGAEPYGGEDASKVTLIKCQDRYDEAVLAGARIRSLVSEGCSFKDIACVSADFDSLKGITDTELERQGIPVYVSGKTCVSSQPAFRLLHAAAAVPAGGWKKEDVIAVAKTGLCSLSPDETDALEVYTDKWSIRGKKSFCTPDGWAMNPDGYTETQSKWARELLTLANSAREKLLPPIEAFSEAFPGTVKDVCCAAYKLLCDFNVYEHLKKEAAAYEAEGRFADAQKKSRVWQALCDVLDTFVSTVPDATVDPKRFCSILRRIADTCSIGTIPDGIDRVALGTVGTVRTDSVKHLIILGAKAGEFPRVPKENSFFSDSDRLLLAKAGVSLAPDTQTKQKEELFRFCAAVTAPQCSLTVLIPSDPSGCHPSLGALRLMKLLPSSPVLDFTGPDSEALIQSYSYPEANGKACGLSADDDRVTGKARARLFDKDIKLTQSRIECFTSCAFQYYCRYVLALDEGRAAELKPAEVGNFVHSVLEHFMREATEGRAFPMEDAEVEERLCRLIADYRARLDLGEQSGYVEYLFQRLSRSILLFARSLNREFSQSRFTPYSFELPVGFSEDLPARPTPLSNGHSMTVRGIVDRVDVLKEDGNVYIRVADYKTGSKKFSLTDVMKGKNIQLLLYLFALCNMPSDCAYAKKLAPNGERIVPAGAVYFSARPGDILSDDLLTEQNAEEYALDAISRTGIVLGDERIIGAMDRDMTGKYAPVTLNSKGGLKGSFAENEEAFTPIKEALDSFLKDVGEQLISGEAGASPKGQKSNSPCRYCEMRPLCRHSEASGDTETKGDDESRGTAYMDSLAN